MAEEIAGRESFQTMLDDARAVNNASSMHSSSSGCRFFRAALPMAATRVLPTRCLRVAQVLPLCGLLLALAGCQSWAPRRLDLPPDPAASQTQSQDEVTVSAAILTDEQARAHFGVDLAKHALQAVWLRVRNASPLRLRLMRGAIDADVYSADEAAFLLRKEVPAAAFEALRQYLRDESIRILLAPRTVNEGFLVVPRAEGGRYLDVQLHSPGRLYRFGFALPLPDGDFDYERLDPARIYGGRELPDLDAEQLRAALERLPCCTSNADGSAEGDPLNVVLVGDAPVTLAALSRSGWSFTHRIDLRTVRRELGAAIAGSPYPVAPVSPLYALGRKQDFAVQRARGTIARRNHMRLWLAPFRFEGRQVWFGQVSRDIGVKLTPKSPTLTTHIIDPAVDEARAYLLQSLFTHDVVARYAFVRGAAAAPRAAPRRNLTDDAYFSDGMRLVVVLAEHRVVPTQIGVYDWEEPEGPIAAGQSDEARKPVPIDAAAP